MSVNSVCISGNLTRDPEQRTTQGGTCVLNMSVAVNDRTRGDDGNWTDRPNYIDCVMFGNRAASVAPYLTKGTKVSIQGKLRWSSWEGKDGGKRSKVEVVVDEIEFMSRRQQTVASQKPAYTHGLFNTTSFADYEPPHLHQAGAYGQHAAQDVYDEDIPF